MTTRQGTLKTFLWALVGVLSVVTFFRFFRGLGATTALDEMTPWGLWIAFDVMAGVALAAGGFVLAATVYIFGLKRYQHFARPAILTAFLGYVAVAVGITYDLGLPWHLWRLISPQPYSVLFEVALCVMLYLTVLFFEFFPVILEHSWFDRPFFQKIYKFVKKIAIPLVIAGIVLSTLHQSSLGSLFLIAPYRLHPLWYSPIIWILFFVSAVGLGLMMVVAESFFSAWFFGHKLRTDLLGGLGKAASVVLLLYAGLRVGDLAARGLLGMAFDGSWQGFLFLFEISFSALIPALLLLVPAVRKRPAGLATCAVMVVLGMIGYRFDVCIVAFARPEGVSYFPAWMEVAVSAGIVACCMLVFIFFVEKLKVYDDHRPASTPPGPKEDACAPATVRSLQPDSLDAPRRYSLAAVAAAAIAIAVLPADAIFGAQAERTAVSPPRTLEGLSTARASGAGHDYALARPETTPPADAERLTLLMIDGNRDGRLVLFPHDGHVARLGDKDSCGACHHQNMPYDRNTACFECHRDMYARTDIFDHSSHIAKLDDNQGCDKCHRDPREIKRRDTATTCIECHAGMPVSDSFVEPPEGGTTGMAIGYMQAMHGLCIECHERKSREEPGPHGLDICTTCHRDIDASHLHRWGPYATGKGKDGTRP